MLRGYVDRLDVAPDGAMRVVDYKTGRSPSELFEGKALFQMKFYALVLWRLRGEIPRLLQLVYLGNGEVVRYAPDEHDLLSLERNLKAVWTAIEHAADDRRLAPQDLQAVRLVRLPRVLPRLGWHSPAAARERRADRAQPRPSRVRSPRPTSEPSLLARPPTRTDTAPVEQRPQVPRARARAGWAPAPRRRSTAPATTCGTARVGTPAATAERTPVGESSMATQSAHLDAERAGRSEVGLGVRLAVLDLVAGDDRGEGALGQRGDDAVGQRPPRHGHQGVRHPGLAQRGEQLDRHRAATARARGPATMTRFEQLLDDLDRARARPGCCPG